MVEQTYIFGRDNYTCCGCGKRPAISTGMINSEDGDITSNTVSLCGRCQDINSYGDPMVFTRIPRISFPGRLIVVTGSMFAEKSTVTKSLVNKYSHSRTYGEYLWIKPTTDDRAEGFSVTHNNEKIEAFTLSQDRPDLALEELKKYKLLAFDEVQFYSERILYVIQELLTDQPRIAIVNGIKLMANRSLFGVLHYLMAMADDIICLKAVCNVCGNIDSATRTKSYRPLAAVSTGGTEAYYAVCPKCDGSHDETKYLETTIQNG